MEMIDGCLDKLVAAIEENSLIIAGVAIGITAVEVRQAYDECTAKTSHRRNIHNVG